MNVIRHRTTRFISASGLLMLAFTAAAPATPPEGTAVETARTVKPSAPVELHYVLDDEPSAGVPLTIELEVTSRVAADSLHVDVAASDDGLVLIAGAKGTSRPADSGRLSQRIVVLPRSDGQYYLNVIATVVRSGMPQARAFSVPVRVGQAASAPVVRAKIKTGPSGRSLISLPAVESGTAL